MKPTHIGCTVARFCRLILIASTSTGIAITNTVQASGFAVPEISVAGLGTANALVANADDPGAFAFNPAAMVFHDRNSIAAGGLFIGPDFSVRTANGRQESQGADWLVAPMMQAAIKLNDHWWAGLGINAPFGLETRWATGTFEPLTFTTTLPNGAEIPISPQPTQSKLETIDIVPTLSYRVNDQWSLSAGADIYWLKSAQLNSSLTDLSGDGTGWGFNLSTLYQQGPWSLGANFHSAATVKVTGKFRPLNQNLAALYIQSGGLMGLPPAQSAELDLNLPWRLQLGARYKLTPKLAVEFDWTRMGWSEFDRIQVESRDTGQVLLEDRNQWQDASAYRLGVTFKLTPETLLRFGYAYDENAQPDDYFSARVPDNDRQLFSLGVSQQLSDTWRIDAGYTFVMFEDRDFDGVRPYNPYQAPADINGTTAIAGEYQSQAHLIGIEVSMSF
ncbi:OmpP1/FadL family transporter [Rhabdochromatium marinum]|uniref:OmpP1/FadL family transporter n=1 Tax=Rhabdochromatium marinum TaxID=48729 RepID=UPI001903ADDA|nr:outer membrane protein transport protein [Rhabdochromatium marinum]MBK1649699.1 aromatic hydrocarbon degradation protein [Rhabdochromatium marinum]